MTILYTGGWITSSKPYSDTWCSFLAKTTEQDYFFGACLDGDCGGVWSLNMETRELRQCGCRRFTPEEPFLPEVAAILRELDTTPKPYRARWVTLGCGRVVKGGVGCGEGTIYLDTASGWCLPCHCCGWFLRGPAFPEEFTI